METLIINYIQLMERQVPHGQEIHGDGIHQVIRFKRLNLQEVDLEM